MKHIFSKALIVATGAALAVQSASAVGNGDLILAFQEPGHNDLLIDLGSASTYLNTTASINLDSVVAAAGNPSFTTVDSLINSVFGTPSASGLTWAVFGRNVVAPNTANIYLTDPTDASSTKSRAIMNQAGSFIGGLSTAFGTGNLVSGVASSVGSAAPGSYTLEDAPIAGQMGFSSDTLIPLTGLTDADFFNFAVSTPGAAAPLAGHFEIGADGSASYDVSAVPEPKTYGILAAGLLALCLRRRFNNKNA